MSSTRPPVTIVAAAALAAAEAIALLVLAVLQLVGGLSGSAAGLAVFFVLCGAGLGWCAWSLFGLSSWARAPIVLAQLIVLGLAWNGRHNAPLAVVLLVVAALALIAIFHPASLAALEPEDEPGDQ